MNTRAEGWERRGKAKIGGDGIGDHDLSFYSELGDDSRFEQPNLFFVLTSLIKQGDVAQRKLVVEARGWPSTGCRGRRLIARETDSSRAVSPEAQCRGGRACQFERPRCA